MLGKSGKGSKKGDYILDDSDANRILYDENGYIPNPNKVKLTLIITIFKQETVNGLK